MEKIRVFALLLLCVALLTVCKAEEEMEMEGQEVEKRALPDCPPGDACNKHKCRCAEGYDCVNDPSTWFKKKVCRTGLPSCAATEDCKKGFCKCEEGKDCGNNPHAKGISSLFAHMVCV